MKRIKLKKRSHGQLTTASLTYYFRVMDFENNMLVVYFVELQYAT
jgi:hypothetical protein